MDEARSSDTFFTFRYLLRQEPDDRSSLLGSVVLDTAKIVYELRPVSCSHELGLNSYEQHPATPRVNSLCVEKLPNCISSPSCILPSSWQECAKVIEVNYVEVPTQMSGPRPRYSYPRSIFLSPSFPTQSSVTKYDEVYFTVVRRKSELGHLQAYGLFHGAEVILVSFYRSHLPKQMFPRLDVL